MRIDQGSGVVVYRNEPQSSEIDAIDAYSRRLVAALRGLGSPAVYQAHGLSEVLRSTGGPPRWVLLQYNPFSYGTWGLAPALVRDAMKVKRRWPRRRLAISVHEAWVPIFDWRSALMGAYQRAQLRALLRLADGVIVAREKLREELPCSCRHIPVGSNIVPVAATAQQARHRLALDDRLVVSLFGRHHPSRALDHAEAALSALASEYGADRLCVLNLGADSPNLSVPAGLEIRTPGSLPDDDLSMHLRASDVLLLPFDDGLSTRRGTLMAGLAHGVPVVGLSGFNTDRVLTESPEAVIMVPYGNVEGYARAVVQLTCDRSRMRSVGVAGGDLYTRRFDWPVVAREVLAVVEAPSGTAA